MLELLDRYPACTTATDEVSPVTADYYQGRIAKASLAESPYDVVMMSHVLEHFSDPGNLLLQVARSLVPGGVLVIEVPNDVDDILCYNGKDEPHLAFFERETLRELIERSGLEILTLYAAGASNVRKTMPMKLKRAVRDAILAVPLVQRLQQGRAARRVASDEGFNRDNPDGLFLRATVRARH